MCLSVCMYSLCVQEPTRSEEGLSSLDPLELNLEWLWTTIVTELIVTVLRTEPSLQELSFLSHWAISPAQD